MTRTAPPAVPEAPRAAPLAVPTVGGRAGGSARRPAQRARAGASAAAVIVPNPALRMDAEPGLVVFEFRDARGEVAASFPTSRELGAYRQAT